MAYQTQKILELDQENQEPIGSLRGAILVNDSGERFFQLKLKNNLAHRIEGAKVQIVCYDEDGMYIGSQSYVYQSVGAKPGEIFGTNRAIPIEFEWTDSFSVIGEELEESEPEIKEEPEPDQEISGDFWERPAQAGKVKGPGTDWPMAVGLGLLAGMLGGICGVAVYLLYIAISWKREGTPGISMERLMPSKDRTPEAWAELIFVAGAIGSFLGGFWLLLYILYRCIDDKKRKQLWKGTMGSSLPLCGGILAVIIIILGVLVALLQVPPELMFRISWYPLDLWRNVGRDVPWIRVFLFDLVIKPIYPLLLMQYTFAGRGLALLPLLALLWEYNQKPTQELRKLSLAYIGVAFFGAISVGFLKSLPGYLILIVIAMIQMAKIVEKRGGVEAWIIPGQIVLVLGSQIVFENDELLLLFMTGSVQALILDIAAIVFLVVKCGIIEGAVFTVASLIQLIQSIAVCPAMYAAWNFREDWISDSQLAAGLVLDIVVGVIALLSIMLLKKMGKER